MSKSNTLSFPQSARRTYTAVKHAFEACDEFHRVRCDEATFVITARHGASLIALGEKIEVHVAATGTQSCEVRILSGNQIFLNILNVGQNKRNVQNLSDWISNQVYKICSDEETNLGPRQGRPLRFKEPDIKFR